MLRKRNAPGRKAEGADLFSRTDQQFLYHSGLAPAMAGLGTALWEASEADAAFAAHRSLLLLENAQPALRSSWVWKLYRAAVWKQFFSTFVREVGDV